MPAPTPETSLPSPAEIKTAPSGKDSVEQQGKSIFQKARDSLKARFMPWVQRKAPDEAFQAITTPVSEDLSEGAGGKEADKKHIDSTQELFDKLKNVSEGELTQESVDLADDLFISLAWQDDLVYSKAGAVLDLFSILEEKARSSGFLAPAGVRQLERAYQRLERKKEIAGVLEEFRSLARTNPDVSKPGNSAIYDFLVGQNASAFGEAFKYLELYPSYIENIKSKLPQFPTVKIEDPPRKDWLVVKSETALSGEQSGRFYLNPNPDYVQLVCINLIQELSKNPNLAFQLKIINPTLYKSPGFEMADMANMSLALTRSDKIALYFDSADQDEVFLILRKFWRHLSTNAAIFDSKKTKFALTPKIWKSRPGLSFGQEPTPEYSSQYSFTDLRAKILQETQNYIDEPDFEKRFMEALKAHNIDPSDPAFNWPQEKGQDHFNRII